MHAAAVSLLAVGLVLMLCDRPTHETTPPPEVPKTAPEPNCLREVVCHRESCTGPVSQRGCLPCPADEYDEGLCDGGRKTLPQWP